MKVREVKEALLLPIEQPLNKLSILSIALFVVNPGNDCRSPAPDRIYYSTALHFNSTGTCLFSSSFPPLGTMEDGEDESSSLIFIVCGAAILYIALVKSERSHPNVSVFQVGSKCVQPEYVLNGSQSSSGTSHLLPIKDIFFLSWTL